MQGLPPHRVGGLFRFRLSQVDEWVCLYIVTYCKGEQSRLRIIQDPFSKPTPKMLYQQAQYYVEEEDRARQGWEVQTTCEAGDRRT